MRKPKPEEADHPCRSFLGTMRLRAADGSYRWFLLRGVPLRDAAGHIVKWFGNSPPAPCLPPTRGSWPTFRKAPGTCSRSSTGGSIAVESVLGQGSRFTVSLGPASLEPIT